MKYLVTGGTGFIGSRLVESIKQSGDEVVVLTSGKYKSDTDAVRYIPGDITNPESLKTVFASDIFDGVFHLAALNNANLSYLHPKEFHEVNICGTFNVFCAARDSGVKNIVYSSSALVYGRTSDSVISEDAPYNPLTPYAVTKVAGEQYCQMFSKQFGMNIAALRYFNVYGPGQDAKSEFAAAIPKFVSMILHGEQPVIYGDGNQARDFVYLDDVVSANLCAMKNTVNGCFNIGSGRSYSLNEIIALICEISEKSVEAVYKPARGPEVKSITADISRAAKCFSYSPAYSIRHGLSETIRWFSTREQ